MKSISSEKWLKIQKTLSNAYYEKKKAALSDGWKAEIMEHIRRKNHDSFRISYIDQFQQLVWRLTPAIGLLIIILSAVLSFMDVIPEDQTVNIRFETPLSLEIFPGIDLKRG